MKSRPINPVWLILSFLIFLYVIISFNEWFFHYYLMHFNGGLKDALESVHIHVENTHINHHKETRLDQSLPDDFIEEGLVFNFIEIENLFQVLYVIIGAYLFWRYCPGFRKSFSLNFVIVLSFFLSLLYLYLWSSIHSGYHGRHIQTGVPLQNNPDKTIHSPFAFFNPDLSSSFYKYLFWYHTLHHLNKGEGKGNYNVLCIFADFVWGTYRSKVDNTVHFSKHPPDNKRDEWLKLHPVFEIRILEKNVIEYRDKGSTEWYKLPRL